MLYSVAFKLLIKEYYYSNLSSHSSLAKMSYLSEISCSKNRTITALGYKSLTPSPFLRDVINVCLFFLPNFIFCSFSGGFGIFHRFPLPPDSVYTSMEALHRSTGSDVANPSSGTGSERYQSRGPHMQARGSRIQAHEPQPSRTNPNVIFRRPNDMAFGLLY